MSEHPYVTDLRFAQSTEVAVEIILRNGVKLMSGVIDVDSTHMIATLYDPQHMGDSTTRRKVNIGDISSLTVTDMEYKFS